MKTALIFSVLIIALQGSLNAQQPSPPAMPGVPTTNTATLSTEGYEGLPWGTPTSGIVAKYPTLWYDPDKDPDFPTAVQGKVKYNSGAIKERTFVTIDNKLVKVLVHYNIESLDAESLLKELVVRHGRNFEQDTKEQMILGTSIEVTSLRWETAESHIIARIVTAAGHESFLMLYLSKEAITRQTKASKSVEF